MTCTKCGETKPVEEFRFHQSIGRRRTRCIACRRLAGRAYYAKDPKKGEAKRDRWTAAHQDRIRISKRASRAVARAIERGILSRPNTCEECGTVGVKIDAAHSDYSRPLDVRWLCRSCHTLWDAHDPKTIL